jgi:hypothetical protein
MAEEFSLTLAKNLQIAYVVKNVINETSHRQITLS